MIGLVAAAFAMASCDGAAENGGTELTLEAVAAENTPTDADMQKACDRLNERLRSARIYGVQVLLSDGKILVLIPRQDADAAVHEEKIADIEKLLTATAKFELLAVYPDSAAVIADPDTQNALAADPAAPEIPAKLGLGDYQILPYPHADEVTGNPVVEYLVLQKPSAAMEKDVYISGDDVAKAACDRAFEGGVEVELTPEGAARLTRLTGAMQIGSDRLAFVLNHQVVFAGIVRGVLGKEIMITGVDDAENMALALSAPLPFELKVTGCRARRVKGKRIQTPF